MTDEYDEADELDEADDDIFDHAVDELDPELQPWVDDVMDRSIRAYRPPLEDSDD